MSDSRCLSCDAPLDKDPRTGCRFPHEHLNLMPRESYRGPEPRDEVWTWPATVAFVALLIFAGFIAWMVWG